MYIVNFEHCSIYKIFACQLKLTITVIWAAFIKLVVYHNFVKESESELIGWDMLMTISGECFISHTWACNMKYMQISFPLIFGVKVVYNFTYVTVHTYIYIHMHTYNYTDTHTYMYA